MAVISPVVDPDVIREGIQVIRNAWGASDMDTILKDLLTAVKSNGGLVLLAREGKTPVGFSFSFPGYRKGRIFLYSHMTGVTKEYRSSGLGMELKLYQRRWALEKGFSLISWTFDPLQGLNSNFNLRKLGAIARTYDRNHYGTMTDSINSGLRSDRVVAEWYLGSKHVLERLDGVRPKYRGMEDAVITREENGLRLVNDVITDLDSTYVRVEIPSDLSLLKTKRPKETVEWRGATASVYETYFAKGYSLTDFYTEGGRNFQVMSKKLPQGVERENIFI
jgi:predicted GNAT superfamily acetyltransferase